MAKPATRREAPDAAAIQARIGHWRAFLSDKTRLPPSIPYDIDPAGRPYTMCAHTSWWQHGAGGGWACRTCHPPLETTHA